MTNLSHSQLTSEIFRVIDPQTKVIIFPFSLIFSITCSWYIKAGADVAIVTKKGDADDMSGGEDGGNDEFRTKESEDVDVDAADAVPSDVDSFEEITHPEPLVDIPPTRPQKYLTEEDVLVSVNMFTSSNSDTIPSALVNAILGTLHCSDMHASSSLKFYSISGLCALQPSLARPKWGDGYSTPPHNIVSVLETFIAAAVLTGKSFLYIIFP